MAFGRLKVDELETSTQTVNVDALVGISADGDKGDITVSGSGTVWTIDDGAVDTAALGGDITAAGKALLDDADAAAQRTTLGAEAAGTASSAISAHEAAADPHPGYALESDLGGAALLDVGTTAGTVAAGDDSRFVPAGGTTGQALIKNSGTDYDASWQDITTRIDDLTDVTITSVADGEVLTYDSATSQWINATPTGGGGTPGGTTGQLQWNSSGSFAGVGGSTVGATGDITLSLNGAADTPPLKLTGTWFSGGTSTTTKPQLLIEPTGTTSTAWSTSGTGLGVNAASGFNGNLLDLQVDGTRQVSFGAVGTSSTAPAITVKTSTIWSPYAGALAFGSSSGSSSLHLEGQLGAGLTSSGSIWWTASSSLGAYSQRDVALKRDQANVLALTNGSTGTGYLKQTPVAVSALPAAATVGAGTRGFVSDSTVAASGNFGATVTGGGSNNVPVFSDGTNWRIG